MVTISKEARALIAAEATDNGQEEDLPFDLSDDERKSANQLIAKLNALISSGKELTPEQKEQADKIEGQLESIFAGAEQRAEAGQGVSINLAEAAEKSETSGRSQSVQDQAIDRLKEQIEKLEEEIKALEQSNLPEKEKTQEIQAKQAQIMELNDQLLKAEQEQLKAQGQSVGGGTRANGFGNSVSNF